MRFTRREVLIAGLAFGCTPARSYAPGFSNEVPSNPDVIVVGAGAAGLGATRTLTHKGKTVVLLEATVRTGGRAFTDYDTFGVPYDVGAHWLHYGKANPFKRYGEHVGDGFHIYQAPNKSIVYKGEEQLCAGNCEAYNAAYEEAVGEIWEARSLDEAASKVVDTQGEWGKTVAFTIGPWETAKHLKDISTRDWSCTIDSDEEICDEGCEDYLCAQGYGALLAHSARGVPVQLQTTVSEIRQTKYGVEVVTNRGTLTARACIVTVSNGVLANGNIAFSPRLPDAKYAAFENVSMGLYNHIGLKFRTNIFGSHSDWFALSQLKAMLGPDTVGKALVVLVHGVGPEHGLELGKGVVDRGLSTFFFELVGEAATDVAIDDPGARHVRDKGDAIGRSSTGTVELG